MVFQLIVEHKHEKFFSETFGCAVLELYTIWLEKISTKSKHKTFWLRNSNLDLLKCSFECLCVCVCAFVWRELHTYIFGEHHLNPLFIINTFACYTRSHNQIFTLVVLSLWLMRMKINNFSAGPEKGCCQ